MRALICCLALSITTACLAAEPSPAPPGAQPTAKGPMPRIAVEPAAFDFGKVQPNQELTKDFIIRNIGLADLLLNEPSTTCGCTAALLNTKIVKPGRSTPLRVTLRTGNYNGRMERAVRVPSNDPGQGIVEVKVAATVTPEPAK